MYVYLKCGNAVKRIPNVTLHDSSKPKVGEVSEDRIDPALWYKVMVLDSIFVDCEYRIVYWNIDKLQGESNFFHKCPAENLKAENVLSFFQNKGKMFEDGERYDYDPTVDELFETANKIFTSLSLDVFDKEGNKPTYENLLKMLHVFILPKIKFQKKDRDSVSVALKWIEHQHDRTEDDIQKKDTTKRNTENSLSKQRDAFLKTDDFSSSRFISSLHEEFLTVFLQHLEKDIRKSNENLIGLDRDISPLRNSLGEKELKILNRKRIERDRVYDALQKCMIAREEILNVISRKHVKKKKQKSKRVSAGQADFYLLYVEISERLLKVNREIQELINTKIKISSVREAVLLTLHELDSDGESYGYNRKKGSFEMETDLFDPTKKPEEWATLQEKVKLLLQVKQVGFRPKFEKFCSRIRLKCQQLYDESKLFGLPETDQDEAECPVSPATTKLLHVLATESRSRRSTRIFPELQPVKDEVTRLKRSFTSRWSIGSISKVESEEICKEITSHISDMAYDIAVELSGLNKEIPRSLHSKIYVCYEEHVSSELMPVLNELYERSYSVQCHHLSDWLSYVCLADIGFGEQKMINLMNFRPSPVSSEESSRECSGEIGDTCLKVPHPGPSIESKTATLGSRSIKDMSLDELYTICNTQCESIPSSFIGALEMDNQDYNVAMSFEEDSEQTLQKRLEADYKEFENDKLGNTTVEMAEDANFLEDSDSWDIISEPSLRKTVHSDPPNSSLPTVMEAEGATNYGAIVNDIVYEGENPPPYEESVTLRRKSPPPPYSTLPPVKEKFYKAFKDFDNCIRNEDRACTLFSKLRHMSRAIRLIELQITKLRQEMGGNALVCADDLVDVVILLLCRLDSELLLKLYAHMNLMIHLSPNFMQGNAHDYALVTFNVAYQHLFEQQVLHRSPDSVLRS